MSFSTCSFALLFLSLFITFDLSFPAKPCKCTSTTDCEKINAADQVITAQISSISSSGEGTAYQIKVQKSYKGTLKPGAKLEIYSNQKCVNLKSSKSFLLSLISNAETKDLYIDPCGFYIPTKNISAELNHTLSNVDLVCSDKCVGVMCPQLWCSNPEFPDGECCGKCPTCADVMCPAVFCSNPIVKSGECCPSCPVCTEMCVKPTCPVPVKEPGQCCGTCPQDCSNVTCPKVDCKDPYFAPGECCGVCPVCTMSCIQTNCSNPIKRPGECCATCPQNCSGVTCPPPGCQNPVDLEGECCPQCSLSCLINNGTRVPSGAKWNPSPCQECVCHNGVPSCEDVECLSCKGESNPVYTTEECCPTCYECPHLLCSIPCEQGYKLNSTTGCPVCDCQDCSKANCPPLNCSSSDAFYIAGNCCKQCPVECTAAVNKTCAPLSNCHSWFTPIGSCCPVCLEQMCDCKKYCGVSDKDKKKETNTTCSECVC